MPAVSSTYSYAEVVVLAVLCLLLATSIASVALIPYLHALQERSKVYNAPGIINTSNGKTSIFISSYYSQNSM